MTDYEPDHRELAEHFLREGKTEPDESAIVCALFAIAHALLAQQEPSYDLRPTINGVEHP